MAKTSTVRAAASVLTEVGKYMLLADPARILCVDLDPQSNLTQAFIGTQKTAALTRGMYEVLIERVPLADVVQQVAPRIWLAPSSPKMELTEYALINERRREDRLKQMLAPVRESYDFILLDCPPNLGILTVNALSAADGVFIPCATDFYSLASLPYTMNTIRDVQKEINPDLRVLGVVATRHLPHTNMAREALEKLTTDLREAGIHMFATVFNERIKHRESQAFQMGITEYAPATEEAKVVRAFVKELIYAK